MAVDFEKKRIVGKKNLEESPPEKMELLFYLGVETYSEPCQTAKMELIAKKVNVFPAFKISFSIEKCEYALVKIAY